MDKHQEVYVEIESIEDETKWKKFLKHHFPNHYAVDILDKNLVTEPSDRFGGRKVHRIGVGIQGFGYLSARCMIVGKRSGVYIKVKDFEEFKETDVYKTIVKQGPKLEKGSPNIIDRDGNLTRGDSNA